MNFRLLRPMHTLDKLAYLFLAFFSRGGGIVADIVPLTFLLSRSFLWFTLYPEHQAFLGKEKERSQTGRGESDRRETTLFLTLPSFRTEYVKGWGKVCVTANGKPVLTSGKVCSPYPPPALFHNFPDLSNEFSQSFFICYQFIYF